MTRRRWWEPLKIAFGVALLVLLGRQVDPAEMASAFRVVRPGFLVPMFALFFALLGVQAWRLHLLIADRTGGYGETLRLVLVGFFFNNLLPSNVGGDAYKAAAVRSGEGSWGGPVGLVVLDRAVGLAVTTLLGAVAFTWIAAAPEGLPGELTGGFGQEPVGGRLAAWMNARWLPWAVALAGLATLAALAALVTGRLPRRLRSFVASLRKALVNVPARTYAALVALSLVAFGLRWARFVVYLWFFEISFPFLEVAVVLAFMTLVGLLPVGLGGLGVQEGTIAYGLALFGAPLELGVAVAVLNRVAIWALSLIGGVLFLWPRRGRDRRPAEKDF